MKLSTKVKPEIMKQVLKDIEPLRVHHGSKNHLMDEPCEKCEQIRPSNCVYCGEEMTLSYGNEEWSAPFCNNKGCPNYALLQTGVLPHD
jgi:hypothetical protein